jgi:PAS domain S-box-containing protein
MRVGELARRTGVGVSTLRAWEARYGFLQPDRSPSGHRLYDEDDVERVSAVVRLANEGMTLASAISRVASTGPGALPDGEAEALLFGQVLDVADQGIWLVHEWRTRYANRAMTELTGYSLEELVSLPVRDLFPPESLPLIEAERDRVRRGEARRFTTTFRRADGSTFLAAVSTTPFVDSAGRYDGAVTLVSDITERAEIETQAHLRGVLLDSIADAVVAGAADGTILYVNSAAERLLSWRASDLVGQSADTLLPNGEDAARREQIAARLLRGRPYSGTMELLRRDGRTFVARVTTTVARDELGEAAGYVSVISEHTDGARNGAEHSQRLRRAETLALLGAQALHHHPGDPGLHNLVMEVVDATRRLLGADHATALDLDAKAKVLRPTAASPAGQAAVEAPHSSRSVAGYIALARRAVVVDDAQHDPRFDPCPSRAAAPTASAVGAPIHGPSGIVGVLLCESTKPKHFEALDAHLVQSMANVIGTALRP